MNRRRLAFAILVAAPSATIAVACTFPEVKFTDNDGGGSSSGTSSSSSGTSGDPVDSGGDGAIVDDSGKPIDIVERPDTGTGGFPDAAACDARCDCDDDGYLDKTKGFCDAGPTKFDDASATKFGDCDDLDSLVHPGQTYSKALPRAGSPKPGDWNCDGEVERAINEDFACAGLVACPQNPPNGKFKSTVNCGQPGDSFTCDPKGLGCAENYHDTLTQACR